MRRPNILLLYTDQQRFDALGAGGNQEILTPNLDRLAAEGINFRNYYVQNPVCAPSRLSFLTGLYPSATGVLGNGVDVPEDTRILPHLLRPYGYRTANLGKLHFLNHSNRDHRIPHPSYGFDRIEISDEPGVYEDAYRAWVRREAPEQLDHLSVGLPPAAAVWNRAMGIKDTVRHPFDGERSDNRGAIAFPGDDRYTHTAFVAERTIQFLEEQDPKQPFLCIAGFYSPHAPWVVPRRFLDLYDRETLSLPRFPDSVNAQRLARTDDLFSDEHLREARHGYYAMVSEVDHHCGRILDCLETRGMRDDTIVVFLSDHGEWLGDHLKYGKGYPAHDVISRVPFLVRWPDGIDRPGSDVFEFVEAVDVIPTLLEAAGVQVPPDLQGRSFANALLGREQVWRDTALTESDGWKCLRGSSWRYLVHRDGREEYWDLSEPLGEYRNVASDPEYATDLAEARRLMLRRLLEAERARPRDWLY